MLFSIERVANPFYRFKKNGKKKQDKNLNN